MNIKENAVTRQCNGILDIMDSLPESNASSEIFRYSFESLSLTLNAYSRQFPLSLRTGNFQVKLALLLSRRKSPALKHASFSFTPIRAIYGASCVVLRAIFSVLHRTLIPIIPNSRHDLRTHIFSSGDYVLTIIYRLDSSIFQDKMIYRDVLILMKNFQGLFLRSPHSKTELRN